MIAEDEENHHFVCSDISYWIDKPCYVDHDFFDRKCFARYVELKQDDEFKSFDDKHSSHYLWEYCLYYLILVHFRLWLDQSQNPHWDFWIQNVHFF